MIMSCLVGNASLLTSRGIFPSSDWKLGIRSTTAGDEHAFYRAAVNASSDKRGPHPCLAPFAPLFHQDATQNDVGGQGLPFKGLCIFLL